MAAGGTEAGTSGEVRANPRDGKAMVFVPAGEFLMGSAPGQAGDEDETPPRPVYLDGYWVTVLPVTVREYRSFCETMRRSMPAAPGWGWHDDHPMVNVCWEEAAAYADWVGGRLPTEAEWEKAARGTDGRRYPWGGEPPGAGGRWRGNLFGAQDGFAHTSPVGHYPDGASPYGCLDMIGNVWEWCADWYGSGYYAAAPARNPTGPRRGSFRVLRGGAWDYPARYVQCTLRYYSAPIDRNEGYGFRCVLHS